MDRLDQYDLDDETHDELIDSALIPPSASGCPYKPTSGTRRASEMAEILPTAIEDAQPVRLGRSESKASNIIHDVEKAKAVTEIELLAASIDPKEQSQWVIPPYMWSRVG